ncbi:MAG: YIP1 family protein [Nevskiaceae bacterium]|jgi:hypothetical protein|nr:YIP1 family protein [Nevskiaceae bacterium]
MTPVQMLVALATAPRRAFESLAQKPNWLFPFLLVLVATLAVTVWYYLKVDLVWITDMQLRANPRTAALTEAQRELLLARVKQYSSVTVWSAVIAVPIMLLAVRALEALWYSLAGKITNVDRGFRQWFALANWTSVFGVIAVIPALIALAMTSGNQIEPGIIQPLSINELFLHRPMGAPGYQLWTNLNLLSFVGAALAIIGVKTWSARSWLFSAIFVLLPAAIILGIVAMFMLR